MIQGDYIEVPRKTKKGTTVMDKVFKDANGTEYTLGPKLGEGGVAPVYKALRRADGKWFAFKEYVPNANLKTIHKRIKENLKTLIRDPIKDSDGSQLKMFVPPIVLVDLPASKGFGYIMELVDTKAYLNYGKKFRRQYPGADIVCQWGKNLAHLFDRLHRGRGWCYKDINEGNIYLDPKTGDILIIDCDNISVPGRNTILGTPGYMAPEVYVTETPDTRTDDHSLAVYLFRLLVWGWPLQGKYTNNYLIRNNTTDKDPDTAAIIYGSDALFCLNPTDTRNTIRGLKTPESKMVETMWDNLPEEIQQKFIQTFCDGLGHREGRTSAQAWYAAFDNVQQNGLVTCPKCGKKNFGSRTNRRKPCMYCDARLPLLPPEKKKGPTPPVTVTPPPTPTKEPTTVNFNVKRDVGGSISVTAKRKTELQGNLLHPSMSSDSVLKLMYNPKRNVIAAVNLSQYDWTVTEDGKKTVCKPGDRVILKVDTTITVIPKKLQLKVKSIS